MIFEIKKNSFANDWVAIWGGALRQSTSPDHNPIICKAFAPSSV